jgi:hypothetical protein
VPQRLSCFESDLFARRARLACALKNSFFAFSKNETHGSAQCSREVALNLASFNHLQSRSQNSVVLPRISLANSSATRAAKTRTISKKQNKSKERYVSIDPGRTFFCSPSSFRPPPGARFVFTGGPSKNVATRPQHTSVWSMLNGVHFRRKKECSTKKK